MKINVNKKMEEKLMQIQGEIIKRGAKGFNINDLISRALENTKDSFWFEEIDKNTPIEYKIKEALNDPKKRNELIHIVSKKNRKKRGNCDTTSN